ncbi:hypothetical protein [Meiothermus sp. CFH 77666]|uniref:hypothetical protein n=1 Tax=Meiothermus sp. CFH 77666 TaxID=2817942 RepID=UPI001AA06336|nr:hypothetical protein [Meiothermus sp. CFH 77666]MBO1438728.1 hypothetical protein [Meiothermus sp. CFH 77666]
MAFHWPSKQVLTQALSVFLSLTLLVVSLELGLRGALMYDTFGLLDQDSLARFNVSGSNVCTTEPSEKEKLPEPHAEHGPLCFLQLLQVEALEPAETHFANLRFLRQIQITSAFVRDAFIKSVAARGPPAG